MQLMFTISKCVVIPQRTRALRGIKLLLHARNHSFNAINPLEFRTAPNRLLAQARERQQGWLRSIHVFGKDLQHAAPADSGRYRVLHTSKGS